MPPGPPSGNAMVNLKANSTAYFNVSHIGPIAVWLLS